MPLTFPPSLYTHSLSCLEIGGKAVRGGIVSLPAFLPMTVALWTTPSHSGGLCLTLERGHSERRRTVAILQPHQEKES